MIKFMYIPTFWSQMKKNYLGGRTTVLHVGKETSTDTTALVAISVV